MFGQLLPNTNKIATVLHSVSGPNFGSRIWYLNKPYVTPIFKDKNRMHKVLMCAQDMIAHISRQIT
jgi:hypothetical protein